MKELLVLAPAKINLHLEVLGLRPDGFHELAMVMQSIDLMDQIEIYKNEQDILSLTCDDKSLRTDQDNLIVRSAQLLIRKLGLQGCGAHINLKKKIPIGAGLAGGSADAAATLMGLNAFWKLGLSIEELEVFAAELGSDISFCLKGGTQLCFGRGERLEPKVIGHSSLAIILIKDPKVSVSTPWAYSRFRDLEGNRYLREESEFEIRREALRKADWVDSFGEKRLLPLRNDLQHVVSSATPSVRLALDLLGGLPGNLGVAMSGSGPSCFALFPDFDTAQSLLFTHQSRLKAVGLNSWCCALTQKGVQIAK